VECWSRSTNHGIALKEKTFLRPPTSHMFSETSWAASPLCMVSPRVIQAKHIGSGNLPRGCILSRFYCHGTFITKSSLLKQKTKLKIRDWRQGNDLDDICWESVSELQGTSCAETIISKEFVCSSAGTCTYCCPGSYIGLVPLSNQPFRLRTNAYYCQYGPEVRE
jgi:hypothetical protein